MAYRLVQPLTTIWWGPPIPSGSVNFDLPERPTMEKNLNYQFGTLSLWYLAEFSWNQIIYPAPSFEDWTFHTNRSLGRVSTDYELPPRGRWPAGDLSGLHHRLDHPELGIKRRPGRQSDHCQSLWCDHRPEARGDSRTAKIGPNWSAGRPELQKITAFEARGISDLFFQTLTRPEIFLVTQGPGPDSPRIFLGNSGLEALARPESFWVPN